MRVCMYVCMYGSRCRPGSQLQAAEAHASSQLNQLEADSGALFEHMKQQFAAQSAHFKARQAALETELSSAVAAAATAATAAAAVTKPQTSSLDEQAGVAADGRGVGLHTLEAVSYTHLTLPTIYSV